MFSAKIFKRSIVFLKFSEFRAILVAELPWLARINSFNCWDAFPPNREFLRMNRLRQGCLLFVFLRGGIFKVMFVSRYKKDLPENGLLWTSRSRSRLVALMHGHRLEMGKVCRRFTIKNYPSWRNVKSCLGFQWPFSPISSIKEDVPSSCCLQSPIFWAICTVKDPFHVQIVLIQEEETLGGHVDCDIGLLERSLVKWRRRSNRSCRNDLTWISTIACRESESCSVEKWIWFPHFIGKMTKKGKFFTLWIET